MALEPSILRSIKKLMNIDMDDPSFDHDVMTYINSSFFHLHQLGVGPLMGFQIESDAETWSDFLGEGVPVVLVNAVKTNIALRVRAAFDPSQVSHVAKALADQQLESDVRISTLREETEWVTPDPSFMVIDGGNPSSG